MNTIFTAKGYKDWVTNQLDAQERGPKRGQWSQLAKAIGVHTSMISQIFRGSKHLSHEQAHEVADHFGLLPIEKELFLTLVQWERAGTQKLKQYLEARLTDLRKKAIELGSRLPQDARLTPEEQATFYSDALYSMARLLTSLPTENTLPKISRILDVPQEKVAGILEFLISKGLILHEEGKYSLGPSRIHVAADSPFVVNHHRNWRIQTLNRLSRVSTDELVFTAPLTLSREDFQKIRAEIVTLIENVSTRVTNSDPQRLAYLTIDWISVTD